jgi:hypothetical protein
VRSVVQIHPDPPYWDVPWWFGKPGCQASDGAIAQLGEHLLCKQGVVGSIPTGSTIFWLARSVQR